VSEADKATMAAAFHRTWEQPAWSTPVGKRLRQHVLDKFIVHARHNKHWPREGRWVREFDNFARQYATMGGTVYLSPEAARADDALNEVFLAAVAAQDRGRSVPCAARRALSAKRKREGGESLNGNEFISLLLAGAKRARPLRPSQAADVPLRVIDGLMRAVESDTGWFDRMIVVMVQVGIVSLMRLIEIRSLRWLGVRFVGQDGSTVNIRKAARAGLARLRGMHVHVAWRKSQQAADCWVPISCQRTMASVISHWERLQQLGYAGSRVFPSRVSGADEARPSDANWIGSQSFVKRWRALLVENNLMSRGEAKAVRGHSLRVTGSNACRRAKVSAETHRIMGGWQALACSASYMAMTPGEQFSVTDKLALQKTRSAAFTPAAATAVFGELLQLN
jgi:hypothetical protein